MHKQPLCQSSYTPVRPKLSKSNAKTIVKQSLHKLETLYTQLPTPQYSSQLFSNIHAPDRSRIQKAVYLQVIDSTYQICLNLETCSKNIRNAIDMTNIILNNCVLGMKSANVTNFLIQDFMVGGFVYLASKYLNEGLEYIPFHLNILKNMAQQETTSQQTGNAVIPN